MLVLLDILNGDLIRSTSDDPAHNTLLTQVVSVAGMFLSLNGRSKPSHSYHRSACMNRNLITSLCPKWRMTEKLGGVKKGARGNYWMALFRRCFPANKQGHRFGLSVEGDQRGSKRKESKFKRIIFLINSLIGTKFYFFTIEQIIICFKSFW